MTADSDLPSRLEKCDSLFRSTLSAVQLLGLAKSHDAWLNMAQLALFYLQDVAGGAACSSGEFHQTPSTPDTLITTLPAYGIFSGSMVVSSFTLAPLHCHVLHWLEAEASIYAI